MARLSRQQIVHLHDTILSSHLAGARDALLTGIDARIINSLAESQDRTPQSQWLLDLTALEQCGRQSDGSLPIEVLLVNAVTLLQGRAEGEVFGEALTIVRTNTAAHQQAAGPNTLPLRRSFVGRKDELDALHRAITSNNPESTQALTLYGLAGTGKTSIALEYAYRHRAEYPGGVWWLNAQGQPLEACLQLAADLQRIGLPHTRSILSQSGAGAKGEELVRAAQLALQAQPEPSLIILDNVTVSAREWTKYLPGGHVRVLATTLDKRLAMGGTFNVGPMSPADSVALAYSILEPLDISEISAASSTLRELGHIPLAVTMAAKLVDLFGSWTQYEQFLRTCTDSITELNFPDQDYPRGVIAALDLSLDRCATQPQVQLLLQGIAVFAPDEVPTSWAEAAAGLSGDHLAMARSMDTLRGLGLVIEDRTAGLVALHRLVRRRVRTIAKNTATWADVCARAVAHVADWVHKTYNLMAVVEIESRLAHIKEAFIIADRLKRPRDYITIASQLATHHQAIGDYDAAQILFERALNTAESLNPPDPDHVARALSNLALLLRDAGSPEQALPLLVRSLEIVEQIEAPNQSRIARRLSSMAIILQDLGKPADAQQLLVRALNITTQCHGEMDKRTAPILSNLATVCHQLGDSTAAFQYLERALYITEHTYGRRHPNVATILSNMVDVAQDTAWLEDSLSPSHCKGTWTLRAQERTYVSSISNTVMQDRSRARILDTTQRNLQVERVAAARKLISRALTIELEIYGQQHPRIGLRYLDLGFVLGTLDDQQDEALNQLQQAFRILIQSNDDKRVESVLDSAVKKLNQGLACRMLEHFESTAMSVVPSRIPLVIHCLLLHHAVECNHSLQASLILKALTKLENDRNAVEKIGERTKERIIDVVLTNAACDPDQSIFELHPDMAVFSVRLVEQLRNRDSRILEIRAWAARVLLTRRSRTTADRSKALKYIREIFGLAPTYFSKSSSGKWMPRLVNTLLAECNEYEIQSYLKWLVNASQSSSSGLGIATIDFISGFANALVQLGHGDMAVDVLEQARISVMDSYLEGEFRSFERQIANAIALIQALLDVQERLFGSHDARIIPTLTLLGKAYCCAPRREDALRCVDRIFSIADALSAPELVTNDIVMLKQELQKTTPNTY